MKRIISEPADELPLALRRPRRGTQKPSMFYSEEKLDDVDDKAPDSSHDAMLLVNNVNPNEDIRSINNVTPSPQPARRSPRNQIIKESNDEPDPPFSRREPQTPNRREWARAPSNLSEFQPELLLCDLIDPPLQEQPQERKWARVPTNLFKFQP
jgi:hypothetical protein